MSGGSTEYRTDTTATLNDSKIYPLTDIDENFEIFLSHFNRVSVFQTARIDFPLMYKEVDMDSENLSLIEGKIEKPDFLKMDFTFDKSMADRTVDAYTQDIDVRNNKATIMIRGVDNGIATDYFFEKRSGK
ncbi:hypothetical protein GCM10027293_32780 [Pontibacter aydingkolensis]